MKIDPTLDMLSRIAGDAVLGPDPSECELWTAAKKLAQIEAQGPGASIADLCEGLKLLKALGMSPASRARPR